MEYQKINQETINRWIEDGWVWGKPISHETYTDALNGKWDILLTPNRKMPHSWIGDIKGKKILGLASGGAQQMPIFNALGAICYVIDYSTKQIESEITFASNENYKINAIVGDITKPLPYEDESFDIIFNPISLCYIEDTHFVFKECYRVLKKGGILISGLDNGVNYMVNEDEKLVTNHFPFNPLINKEQRELLEKEDCGIQFSHTLEDTIGALLKSGFTILDLYEDTNNEGYLKELNIPTSFAVKTIKNS